MAPSILVQLQSSDDVSHPKGVFSRLGRSKYLSSGRPGAQGAAAVMAAAYYYQYHETDECRQLREGYNETNTGEKGSFEDPATRMECAGCEGTCDAHRDAD